jgi:hypothetical protein
MLHCRLARTYLVYGLKAYFNMLSRLLGAPLRWHRLWRPQRSHIVQSGFDLAITL